MLRELGQRLLAQVAAQPSPGVCLLGAGLVLGGTAGAGSGGRAGLRFGVQQDWLGLVSGTRTRTGAASPSWHQDRPRLAPTSCTLRPLSTGRDWGSPASTPLWRYRVWGDRDRWHRKSGGWGQAQGAALPRAPLREGDSQRCLLTLPQVVFTITDPAQKLHVPLLISPYSYTTYRGS